MMMTWVFLWLGFSRIEAFSGEILVPNSVDQEKGMGKRGKRWNHKEKMDDEVRKVKAK